MRLGLQFPRFLWTILHAIRPHASHTIPGLVLFLLLTAHRAPWMGSNPVSQLQIRGLSYLVCFLKLTLTEKAMATHSSTLAWEIPWTEEPGGLPSMALHRVRHDWRNLAAAAATAQSRKELLKIPQAKFQQNVNHEFPDIQAGFTKGRGIEIKLSTPIVSSKKQENSRKASTPICLCKRLWLTQKK